MPAVRNNILMVLAQKAAADLQSHEGKMKLAREIRRAGLDAQVGTWSNEWSEGLRRGTLATELGGVFVRCDVSQEADGRAVVAAATALGIMGGAWWSGFLAGRVKPRHQIRHGFLIMLVATVVNVLLNLWLVPHAAWALFPIALFALGWSLMVPVVTLMVLDLAPERRGIEAKSPGPSPMRISSGW